MLEGGFHRTTRHRRLFIRHSRVGGNPDLRLRAREARAMWTADCLRPRPSNHIWFAIPEKLTGIPRINPESAAATSLRLEWHIIRLR